jgi:hypothetical protein
MRRWLGSSRQAPCITIRSGSCKARAHVRGQTAKKQNVGLRLLVTKTEKAELQVRDEQKCTRRKRAHELLLERPSTCRLQRRGGRAKHMRDGEELVVTTCAWRRTGGRKGPLAMASPVDEDGGQGRIW